MRVRECIPTNGSVPDLIIWNVFWEQAVIFRNGCYWFVHDTWCVRCGSVSAYVWVNGVCHFCRWIGKFSTGSRDRFFSSRSLVRRLADVVHANCLLVNCEFALPKILGGGVPHSSQNLTSISHQIYDFPDPFPDHLKRPLIALFSPWFVLFLNLFGRRISLVNVKITRKKWKCAISYFPVKSILYSRLKRQNL